MKKLTIILLSVILGSIFLASCNTYKRGYSDTYQHKECLGSGRVGHKAAY